MENEKYHATRVPTLLIGIGGIGGQIVQKVSSLLNGFDKQFVNLLVMDTNSVDLRELKEAAIPYIQTSEIMSVKEYLDENEKFLAWFPQNPHISSKLLTDGAGQIRSVSRLGGLASEDAGKYDAIDDAIRDCFVNRGDDLVTGARVMIVGSICGGTGSGLGIQLPFLIREKIKDITGITNTKIRGVFIGPQLVEAKQQTAETKDAVKVNAYAFLREYNAFNSVQLSNIDDVKLSIEHYKLNDKGVKQNNPVPYDYMFLVEESASNGKNIGQLEDYIGKTAEIVKTQLFSPMQDGQFSAEDNLIISFIPAGGMNRYCGSGISTAVYPFDEIRKYCTLRFSESIIDSSWTYVDRKYKNNERVHEMQMNTGTTIEPLDRGKEFIKIFDKYTDTESSDVSPAMLAVKKDLETEFEVFDEEQGKNVRRTSVTSKRLFSAIINYLDESLFGNENEDQNTDEDLVMIRGILEDYQKAPSHIEDTLNNIDDYAKKLNDKIDNIVTDCTEAVFPSNIELAKEETSDKTPYNIFHALHKVHPIAARYLLYKLRESFKLELKKSEADKSDAEDEVDTNIFNTDYFNKKDGHRDSAAEAVQLTDPGRKARKTGTHHNAEYISLINQIIKDAADEVGRIEKYARAKLHINVCRNMLARIEYFINLYEEFFDKLDDILNDTKEKRILEERDYIGDEPRRDEGANIKICADKACKEYLYNDLEISTEESVNLDVATKMDFFELMYKEYTQNYSKDHLNRRHVQRAMKMEDVFKKGILEPLEKTMLIKKFKYLDLNIIEAINKELDVYKENENTDVTTEYNSKTYAQYFAEICNQLRTKATPYLGFRTNAGNTVCHWGINSEVVANYQNKTENDIDEGALLKMMGASGSATYTAISDSSYAKNELVCYSSIYGLAIDDLSQYRMDGRIAKAYYERMKRVVEKDFDISNKYSVDAYMDTVHPHLDKRWVSHAYLPELLASDEKEMKEKIDKAFIKVLSRDRCRYFAENATKAWHIQLQGMRYYADIFKDEMLLTNFAYDELYDALNYNSIIVDDIVDEYEKAVDEAYSTIKASGVSPQELLEHPIIKGLIGKDKTSFTDFDYALEAAAYKEDGNTTNILDILYTLYVSTDKIILVENLFKTLEKVIYEYCFRMSKQREEAAKILTDNVKKAIFNNSLFKDVGGSFTAECESFIKQ